VKLRLITEILADNREKARAMGDSAFHAALHKNPIDPTLKELKESLELGFFAELYNSLSNTPKLLYASHNPDQNDRADFTVWDSSRTWSRDVESTSFWREGDFPEIGTDDPWFKHVLIDNPKKPFELQRKLEREIRRVVKSHARRVKYPAYWLICYANISLQYYDLKPSHAADVVRQFLIERPPSPNLERVWLWKDQIDLAFP